MKKTEWNNYWDKKINEHFKVKPAERIDLREFVESVYNEKYGIEEAEMSVPNLLKRDNIDTFINMINGGTPFQLSAKWLGKTDVDDTLKDSLVVIEKGPNTKESLAKIKKYKESGDTRDLKGMKFDTDMVYADDEWKPTDEVITIGLNAIEKTKEFGSRGGKEPTGAEWEAIIAYVKNGKQTPEGGETAVTKFIKSTMPYEKQAEDMLKSLGGKLPKGKFELAGQDKSDLSDLWLKAFRSVGSEAGGATKTSKTDVKSGNTKMSFKKAGGSQLMSGGQGETMATILAVEKATNITDKTTKELLENFKGDIKKKFERLNLDDKETIGKIQKSAAEKRKKGKALTQRETEVEAMTAANQQMTTNVRELFNKTIPGTLSKAAQKIYGNPDFKYYVCKEAMTGEIKFSNGPAAANTMFVFDPSRRVAAIEPISDKEVAKVAANTSFNVSFKSSGEGGNAWIALKGIYQDKKLEEESIALTPDEIISEFVTREFDRALSETVLEEGLWDDFVAGAKSAVSKVTNFVSDIYNKVKEKVLKAIMFVIDKAIELAQNGFAAVAAFFGVKMESAKMTKNPDIADSLLP